MKRREKYLLCLLLIFASIFCLGLAGGLIPTWHVDGSGNAVTTRPVSIKNTLQGDMNLISDGDGYTIAAGDQGSAIWMTGAGEVALPACTTSTIGRYYYIFVRDAAEQVEVVLQDSADLIVLADGTALDADDEADMATGASSSATFMCAEDGKYYIIAENGTVTDGGAAD
jgi:hypothetical protein